jgi:hypothetical protein
VAAGRQGSTVVDPDPFDPVLPRWHWRSRHTAFLEGTTPEAAFAAVRSVTRAELAATAARRPEDRAATVVEDLDRQGFVALGDPGPTTLLVGRVGHLWQAGRATGRPSVTADSFASFSESGGYAKSAMLLAARPFGPDTVLVAEWRVLAIDEHALAGFSGQWLIATWSRRLPPAELLVAIRRRLGVGRHSERRRAA